MKKQKISEPDIFDILSATWIMSANDENPIMTYEGIKLRLNLPKNYDVKSIVNSRGDLFRKGVPSYRLEEWKADMLQGNHLSSWIREIKNKEEREKIIRQLSVEDVFRNQFRTKHNDPTLQIEIINWGLEHIDRLRKANLEFKEQIAKSWEIRLVFFISLLNIVLSTTAIILNIK